MKNKDLELAQIVLAKFLAAHEASMPITAETADEAREVLGGLPNAQRIYARWEEANPVAGNTVAERLDAMADECPAGSQRQSDLYAASTVWRKHVNRRPLSTTEKSPNRFRRW